MKIYRRKEQQTDAAASRGTGGPKDPHARSYGITKRSPAPIALTGTWGATRANKLARGIGSSSGRIRSMMYAAIAVAMVFVVSCFVVTGMSEATDPVVATFTWNESELSGGTTTELVITVTGTGIMPNYVEDGAASGTKAPWKDYRGTITAVNMVENGGSITKISHYAFYNITKMTQMDISQSIEEVDAGSFEGCTALERFSVSAANAKLLDDNGVLYEQSAFMPTKLVAFPPAYKSGTGYASSYTMVQEATGIAEKAFKGATYLASVQLSSSLTSIGDEAFYGCTGITSIYLPKTVASIGEDAFFGMTSLESLDVDSKNQTYTAMNGCLFTDWIDENEETHENGELLFSPINNIGYQSAKNGFDKHAWNNEGGNKAYSWAMPIPFCVRQIHERAFYNSVITDVYISDNVRYIGDQAFEGCASLTSVYIPSSVETIGRAAFKNCTNMSSVYMPAIDLTEGEEFAGCRSLILLQVAGFSGAEHSIMTTSLPSTSWNNTTSTKWMTWECGKTDWTNVDPTTDVDGKEQERAGNLDLNKSNSVLKSGWLYYRQAVAKTDGTKCKIYDATTVDPNTVYFHRVSFTDVGDTIETYDPIVVSWSLPGYQKGYNLHGADESIATLAIKSVRNVIIPEPGGTTANEVSFNTDSVIDLPKCALIHVPSHAYFKQESFLGRSSEVVLCLLGETSLNSGRYYSNVKYLELEGEDKVDGLYLDEYGYPLAYQPKRSYVELLNNSEGISATTNYLRDNSPVYAAFDEGGFSPTISSMLRFTPPVVYVHAMKATNTVNTSNGGTLFYIGSGSEVSTVSFVYKTYSNSNCVR